MSNTADPQGAQAHARAMGNMRVPAMPTLPASAAATRPPGVSASSMVWETTLASGGYAGKELARGTRLQLQDLQGDGCVSMLIFNAERPVERLNVADTIKVQWSAYLGTGTLLLSDMGRVLMSIIDDDAGSHDAFCGASTARSNAHAYGDGANWGAHPNARDRFALAAAKFGLGPKDIHPCINWFKGVRIAANGSTELEVGPFAAGRSLTLRAEMNVIVVLANCPHRLDPRAQYSVSPVRASAWRGEPTPQNDPIRNATPEGLRAFLNVEDYFCR
jgi:urea carboxylase-associated protein 2